MTFGSGISFNVSNVSGLNKTLTSLANFNTSLTALLCPCDANDNEISWEEATKSDNAGGIKAKSLKSKIGFWSDKFVSALGKNDNEGGGIIGQRRCRSSPTYRCQGCATATCCNSTGRSGRTSPCRPCAPI